MVQTRYSGIFYDVQTQENILSSIFLLNAILTELINDVYKHLRLKAEQNSEAWYVDNFITNINNEE